MKPCTDCKFHQPDHLYPASFDRCTRRYSSITVPDIVRGGMKTVDTTPLSANLKCEDERTALRPWKCGAKARHFQPKVKTPEDYHL